MAGTAETSRATAEAKARTVEIEAKRLALQFHRNEVMFESSLLNNRITWFVVVQSFLLTSFSVAIGQKFSRVNWLAQILLPGMGILTSVLIIPAINGACSTIDLWLDKQRVLLNESKDQLKDFFIWRDGAKPGEDPVHVTSYYFARWLPWITIMFWILVALLTFTFPISYATTIP
jgi:hypothetical protein